MYEVSQPQISPAIYLPEKGQPVPGQLTLQLSTMHLMFKPDEERQKNRHATLCLDVLTFRDVRSGPKVCVSQQAREQNQLFTQLCTSMPTQSHSCSPTRTRPHTHAHTHPHARTHARTHTHTPSHTHTHSFTHSHTHSLQPPPDRPFKAKPSQRVQKQMGNIEFFTKRLRYGR